MSVWEESMDLVFLALDPDLRSEKLKARIFGLSNTGSV